MQTADFLGRKEGRKEGGADRQLAVCECVCSSWQCVSVCARAPSNQLGGGGGGAIKRAKERAGAATETISLSRSPRAFSLSFSQSTLLFVSSVLPPFLDAVSEGWDGPEWNDLIQHTIIDAQHNDLLFFTSFTLKRD